MSNSVTREVTLDQLLDEAVQTLPLIRRRVMQARVSNPRTRARILDEIQLAVYDDPRAAAMGIQPLFGSDTFTAQTPFQIDVDNLERILAMIIEYLPQIFSIITALFASFLMFALIGVAASAASAADLNPLSLAEIRHQTAVEQPSQQPAVSVQQTSGSPLALGEGLGVMARDCQPCVCGCDSSPCECENCPCSKPAEVQPSDVIRDPVTGIEVRGPAAIQLSTPGCGPCIVGWRQDESGIRNRGWETHQTYDAPAESYPTWRIYDGTTWHTHTGRLAPEQLIDFRAPVQSPTPVTLPPDNVLPPVVLPMQSNCPGGVCPSPQMSGSVGPFRRLFRR